MGGQDLTTRKEEQIFDDWPERYEHWFVTPIGSLVGKYEQELILDLLKPGPGDKILDAGCGTGVFTLDFIQAGSKVTGLDISLPMLLRARSKTTGSLLDPLLGDMLALPFRDNSFDKAVSITALEFIEDGRSVLRELFRVTRKGGMIVVATLNSLSPWAEMRKKEASEGHPIFQKAIFRSPGELLSLADREGLAKTVIHFRKDDDPDCVPAIEEEGRKRGLNTGAFVAARWIKQ
jgi:ubiquinone/menaquinone biosynthesis C-methylase UbiE